jgi:hypothetical protein
LHTIERGVVFVKHSIKIPKKVGTGAKATAQSRGSNIHSIHVYINSEDGILDLTHQNRAIHLQVFGRAIKMMLGIRRLVSANGIFNGSKKRIGISMRAMTSVSAAESHEPAVLLPQMPAFDYKPQPYTGPLADEILKKRKQFLGPSNFYFYDKPVSIA